MSWALICAVIALLIAVFWAGAAFGFYVSNRPIRRAAHANIERARREIEQGARPRKETAA